MRMIDITKVKKQTNKEQLTKQIVQKPIDQIT